MTEQASEPGPPATSARALWSVVLLVLAAALLLWAASALTWATATFRTPFSGDVPSAVSGSVARPELVPLALAGLAAIAAVLATGGLLRRVVGALTALGGLLLGWRAVSWFRTGPAEVPPGPGVPPGSAQIGVQTAAPYGPLLVALAGLALLAAGVLVAARAHRMPGMGARYSAPGARKQSRGDPDKRLWDAQDEGTDPTDEQ